MGPLNSVLKRHLRELRESCLCFVQIGLTINDTVSRQNVELKRQSAAVTMQVSQPTGRKDFALEFGVGLVEWYLVILAGGEAAIGIQSDPFGSDKLQRRLHTLYNLLW